MSICNRLVYKDSLECATEAVAKATIKLDSRKVQVNYSLFFSNT